MPTVLVVNIPWSKTAGGGFDLDESCWLNPNLPAWPEPQTLSLSPSLSLCLPDTANCFNVCTVCLPWADFHQPGLLCQNIIYHTAGLQPNYDSCTHTHAVEHNYYNCVLRSRKYCVRPRLHTLSCMIKDLFLSGTVLCGYPKIDPAISYWLWD